MGLCQEFIFKKIKKAQKNIGYRLKSIFPDSKDCYRVRLWTVIAIGVGCAAACVSLPSSAPHVSKESTQPAQFKNESGPLSSQKSAAIVENLKEQTGATEILDRHIAVEEAIVGRPLVTGNKVVLLQDGPATYRSMFAALRAAKDHINLETYIFDDDEIGQQFANILIQKQSQGVQVNIIYDSVGAINTQREFFAALADTGIRIVEFNPINPLETKKGWQVNQRDHRKLLLIDGEIAFIGGINISGVYSRGSFSKSTAKNAKKKIKWRDTHLRIEGPVVRDFQRYFLSSWHKQQGVLLAPKNYFPDLKAHGSEFVRAIGSAAGEPYNPFYVTLLSAIENAEKQVYITNAYFAPDPQLLDAIKQAAARGVDVRLILPSNTDFWVVFHAGRSHYAELLQAGVKIYERQGALLHSKTIIVDGVWSSVGSTNLDWRSFVHNDEINAVILGHEFATEMQAMFDADMQASKTIVMDDWERRSPLLRLKEWAAQLWEYWL